MDIEKFKLTENISIRESLKIIDEGGLGIGIVVNRKNKVIGVVTDGDFRRAVLNGVDLTNDVREIYNKDFVYVEKNVTEKIIVNSFLKKTHKCIFFL